LSELGYLIVARCNDGELLRGTSDDFDPERFFFHVFDGRLRRPIRVLRDQLKAAFFVKTLDGDPLHEERKTFDETVPQHTKVWVTFQDGEQLAGWTDEYDVRKQGFTIFPADPESNIGSAWIPHAATESVRLGNEAELAARAFGRRGRARQRRITPRDWDAMLAIEPATLHRAADEHRRAVANRLRAQHRPSPRR